MEEEGMAHSMCSENGRQIPVDYLGGAVRDNTLIGAPIWVKAMLEIRYNINKILIIQGG
jgi:hypothetical protein